MNIKIIISFINSLVSSRNYVGTLCITGHILLTILSQPPKKKNGMTTIIKNN